MIIHPDKNEHPKAKECFQKINKAKNILTDPDQRAEFDRYGPEEDRKHQGNEAPTETETGDIFMMIFEVFSGERAIQHDGRYVVYMQRGKASFCFYFLMFLWVTCTVIPYIPVSVVF